MRQFSVCLTFGFLLTLFVFSSTTPAQAQWKPLHWKARQDLNILLPPSVQVYESYGTLPDGAPLHAQYTLVDLTDKNLKFKAVGDNLARFSAKEFGEQHQALIAINGGYYSGTASSSLIIQDGTVLAPPPTHNPNPVKSPAKGAFGMVHDKPDVAWNYNFNALPYEFTKPQVRSIQNQTQAQLWPASQAIGGGPVLVENWKIKIASAAEGFGGTHLWRHPRTAIGYLDSTKVIMMVVDGRQQGSAGVTLEELAQIFVDLGAQEAVNLDGGGSSQMVALQEVVNLPEGNRNVLRRNASAFLLKQQQVSAQKKVFIFDTEGSAYTERGLWQASNYLNFYGTSPARVASVSPEPTSALFRFDSLAAGNYQLAAWWPANQNLAQKVPYVLHRFNKKDTLFVDQSSFQTLGKWNVLGEFNLQPGHYLELLAAGQGKQVAADAIRLVPLGPTRGDIRLAVISDLNSAYGDTTFEAQVGETLQRLPQLWKPDLVVAGGDLVAGQSRQLTDERLKAMWRGFDRAIFQPLRKANIPFAFTIGNHDGSGGGGFERERAVTESFWKNPAHRPGLAMVDSTRFPFFYSFVQNGLFFVSWDASSAKMSDQDLAWVRRAFSSPEAIKAPMRILVGHIPLYGVGQERDSPGNVLHEPEKIQQMLEDLNVRMYISGHHHAYYPGKRGSVELLNTGALGSGPRKLLTRAETSPHTVTLVDIFLEQDSLAYTTFDVGNIAQNQLPIVDDKTLPPLLFGHNGFIRRRDVAPAQAAFATFAGENLDNVPSSQNLKGDASARLQNNQLELQAFLTSFSKNRPKTAWQLVLYEGRHGSAGKTIARFSPTKSKKNRLEFNSTLPTQPGFAELLGAGGLYLALESADSSVQIARAQLYPVQNKAPNAPAFASHQSRNVYAIRQTEALFPISWQPATDPDQDPVTFTYQVSAEPDFKNIAWDLPSGKATSVKVKENAWLAFLKDLRPGQVKTVYHRLLVSDGKHVTIGPATALQLTTSQQQVTGPVEVEAPNWVAKGTLGGTILAPHGIAAAGNGNLWIIGHTTGIYVRQPNGKPVALSSDKLSFVDGDASLIKSISVDGKTIPAVTLRGISRDVDGHLLVIVNNIHLMKLHQITGEPLAYWEAPSTLAQVTAAEDGTILATSVVAEGRSFILRQAGNTFEVTPITLLSGRPLARTSQLSADGKMMFIPSATDPGIWVYQRNKTGFTPAERLSNTAAGSNAIARHQDGSIWLVVKSDGFSPAQLQMINLATARFWSLPLPALAKEGGYDEARGLTFSPDGKTIYMTGYDTGKIYIYQLE